MLLVLFLVLYSEMQVCKKLKSYYITDNQTIIARALYKGKDFYSCLREMPNSENELMLQSSKKFTSKYSYLSPKKTK